MFYFHYIQLSFNFLKRLFMSQLGIALFSSLSVVFITSCAPKDTPDPNSKNSKISTQSDKDKIIVSGYTGTGYDVTAYNLQRLMEAKQLFDTVLQLDRITEAGNCNKYNLKLTSTNEFEFTRDKTSCHPQSSQRVSTTINAFEKFHVQTLPLDISSEDKNEDPKSDSKPSLSINDLLLNFLPVSKSLHQKRATAKLIRNFEYTSDDYKVNLRARKISGLQSDSLTFINENRRLEVSPDLGVNTDCARINDNSSLLRFVFTYIVNSKFDQTMRQDRLQSKESNSESINKITGCFLVDPYEEVVTAIENLNINFLLVSPRQVQVKRKKWDPLFENGKNILGLNVSSLKVEKGKLVDFTYLYMNPACGNPEGDFYINLYKNNNESRNKFNGDKNLKNLHVESFGDLDKKSVISPSFANETPFCYNQKPYENSVNYELIYQR